MMHGLKYSMWYVLLHSMSYALQYAVKERTESGMPCRINESCAVASGGIWMRHHWSPTVPVSVWLPEPARDRGSKRRFLPHHKSQCCDIWRTNSPVVSCFNPNFVDRSVPYEAKQRRVKFRRFFGNIPPLAECNVSVPNVRSIHVVK